jgi:hypothetical protein
MHEYECRRRGHGKKTNVGFVAAVRCQCFRRAAMQRRHRRAGAGPGTGSDSRDLTSKDGDVLRARFPAGGSTSNILQKGFPVFRVHQSFSFLHRNGSLPVIEGSRDVGFPLIPLKNFIFCRDHSS